MRNNNTNDLHLLSETVNMVRFPMAVLVVFIHTCSTHIDLTDISHIIYQLIRAFFSSVLGQVAVPTFFLISGYLFYQNLDKWNWQIYFEKLKRRICSLFVPYIIWNTLYIFFALTGAIYSVVFKGTSYTVLTDWIKTQGLFHLYWDGIYLVPLWFVRDLMMIVLFAAVIYVYVRYLRIFSILLSIVLYFFCDFIPYSFVFFIIGSYFSLFREKVNYLFNSRIRLIVILVFMNTLLLNIYCMYVNSEILEVFQKCNVLIGVFAVMSIGYEMKMRWTVPSRFWIESSFFVFVFHYFMCHDVSRIVRYMIGTNSQIQLIMVYFLSNFIVVCSCIITYMLFNKFMPKVLKVLVGGR
jgi:hypothetical protein